MTAIFHFTHEANLDAILSERALLCDYHCRAMGRTARDIAYPNLKQRRAQTRVEIAPGSTLDYYVPFYFGARSPMLYAYQGGYVTGKPESPDEIFYLVSTAETVAQSGVPFVFTDGHPLREPKAFYNDLTQLGHVDLPLMTATYWNDTDDDPDRKRRRQAEFLVWGSAQLNLIKGFAARTEAKRQLLEDLLAKHAFKIPTHVRQGWYYG